jgi:hypothetical protein
MTKSCVASAIALCALWAGAAGAEPIFWKTESGYGSCTGGVGNSCSFTSYGETLSARAYATSNDSGTGAFEDATLTVWSGGLGVRNADNSNETSSPNHAVDNYGRDDLIVFENSDPYYAFTGFRIGWKQGDADIRAFVGGAGLGANFDFEGESFADLLTMGFTQFNFSNVAVNSVQSFGSEVDGPYLIIAAQTLGGNFDLNKDYFKVDKITGVTTVPEPATAALLAFGLAGLGLARRRKSR